MLPSTWRLMPPMPPSTRKPTKTLCLVVWNEIAGCKIDVPLLPRECFDAIYAVDGGSTDGTVAFLESQGIPVHRQREKSLNAAYAEAVALARTEAVVVFFPKGTLNPAILREFARLLDQGFELVVASRNMRGGQNEEDGNFLKPRKWGVQALGRFASFVWRREGWRIRDVLHGVKAFTVDAFRRMKVSETGVTIDLEMTVRAYRLRISRIEFPVIESAGPPGETRFKIWPTGRRLARFLWSELFRPL
jgi:hypothetical protein